VLAVQLNHTESYLLVKDAVKHNPVSIEPNFGQDYDPFSEEPAPHVAMEKAPRTRKPANQFADVCRKLFFSWR
jgi:hypothetical protein